MSRCLVTGASGFIGSYLIEYLLSRGADVFGIDRGLSKNIELKDMNFQFIQCNILDKEYINKLVTDIKPDYVYHLAAQSLPKISWEDPEATFQINLIGTLYLLDAIRNNGINPTIEVFCSSGEYAINNKGGPISEDYPLEPANPYALTKIAQDHLSVLYHKAYHLQIVRVRPFFIIGPRKTGDVCSDIARGIVAIERGASTTLQVGNTDIVRDFLDIRDAVSAMCIVAEKGIPGDVYNICSGQGYKIGDIVEQFCRLSNVPIEVRSDYTLFRRLDEPIKIGDNEKLCGLGWKPLKTIDDSLKFILESWRNEMRE